MPSAADRKLTVQAVLALIMLTVALTGCSSAADQVLPTPIPAALLPTDPPTNNMPTNPAADLGPSPTADDNAVPTLSPDSLSPTPLFGPSPIGQRLLPTLTPKSAIPGAMRIDYFAADSQAVKPGDSLTLFWSVRGTEEAYIYRLKPNGKPEQMWKVQRVGRLRVPTHPDDRGQVQFALALTADPTIISASSLAASNASQTLTIFVTCVDPCVGGAPGSTADSSGILSGAPQSPAAQQTFQQGLMIWIQSQSRIYVLYKDGQSPAWAFYPDEFKDGQQESDPSLVPPAGVSQPVRGFGLVWRTRENVRKRLGWATGSESPFTAAIQGDATVAHGIMTLRAKDNVLLRLENQGQIWRPVTSP